MNDMKLPYTSDLANILKQEYVEKNPKNQHKKLDSRMKCEGKEWNMCRQETIIYAQSGKMSEHKWRKQAVA